MSTRFHLQSNSVHERGKGGGVLRERLNCTVKFSKTTDYILGIPRELRLRSVQSFFVGSPCDGAMEPGHWL